MANTDEAIFFQPMLDATSRVDADELVDVVFEQCCAGVTFYERKANPARGAKRQLKVLLLNLLLSVDRTFPLALPLSPRTYDLARYQKANVSYNITKKLLDQLVEHELVTLRLGSEFTGYSRLTATHLLTNIFKALKLTDKLIDWSNVETVLMFDKDDNKKRKEVDYEDTDEVREWRTLLKRYNELLRSSLIDIPEQEKYLARFEKNGKPRIENLKNIHVRRSFSRSSWDCNGRFYGGFWIRINKEQRDKIHIDGEPTVSFDFSSLHPNLLYAVEKTQPKSEDIYDIGLQQADLVMKKDTTRPTYPIDSPKYFRNKWIKPLVLTSLNAKSDSATFKSFLDKQETGHRLKRLKHSELKQILDAFRKAHPSIAKYVSADTGIWLMRMDSNVCEHVIRAMTKKNKPVLTVHDGFICKRRDAFDLLDAMMTGSYKIVGKPLPLDLEMWRDRHEQSIQTKLTELQIAADLLDGLANQTEDRSLETMTLLSQAIMQLTYENEKERSQQEDNKDTRLRFAAKIMNKTKTQVISKRAKGDLLNWLQEQGINAYQAYEDHYSHYYKEH